MFLFETAGHWSFWSKLMGFLGFEWYGFIVNKMTDPRNLAYQQFNPAMFEEITFFQTTTCV